MTMSIFPHVCQIPRTRTFSTSWRGDQLGVATWCVGHLLPVMALVSPQTTMAANDRATRESGVCQPHLSWVVCPASATTDGERSVSGDTASAAKCDGQVCEPAYAAPKGGVAAMGSPIDREVAETSFG
jgi:hypothetical protein